MNNTLIDILDSKQELLSSILKLTQQQEAAIESEDVDYLEELLKTKAERIKKITELDKDFENKALEIKAREGVKELSQLSFSSKLKEKQGGIKKILLGIRDLEVSNIKAMKNSTDQLKTKANKIVKGKKAVSGYHGGPSSKEGSFLDQKR